MIESSGELPPPINKKTAIEICGGDEDLFNEMAEIFLQDVNDLEQKLKKALEADNAEDVKEHAHAIKGASANIAAGPLKEAASQLENVAREKDLRQGASLFQKVDIELRRVREYLAGTVPPGMSGAG